MSSLTALSDAAIVYGAQRYFDGLHDNVEWLFQSKYQKVDDKLLFMELLHNICLYDQIVLDDRPIEEFERDAVEARNEFLEEVNKILGRKVFVFRALGNESVRSEYVEDPHIVQAGICKLIASYVNKNNTEKIRLVQIPWAYSEPHHHDRTSIQRHLRQAELNEFWLPFALFVWRGIWYGAVASRQAKKFKMPTAYVAAPNRIAALESVLNAKDIAKFKFRLEAMKSLSWALPGLPERGYDFGYLDFVSPFATSALAEGVSEMSPIEALKFVSKYRASREAVALRKDFAELLLQGQNTCSVGTTSVQIIRDVTVHGDLNQTTQLRAIPAA